MQMCIQAGDNWFWLVEGSLTDGQDSHFPTTQTQLAVVVQYLVDEQLSSDTTNMTYVVE